MLKKLLKYLLYLLSGLLVVSICLIAPIDKKPYAEKAFYDEMNLRLDSLQKHYQESISADSLWIGTSKISITPKEVTALAGYGARDPKEFSSVLDSVFVRTLVLKTATSKVALITPDLLIVHPEVAAAVYNQLQNHGWSSQQIYFSATHTHSSVGSWAPKMAGKVIAGSFDQAVFDFIVEQMVASVLAADQNMAWAQAGYLNNELGMCVKNRLIKNGPEDAWMRNLFFPSENGLVSLTAYAAHATCFGARSHELTGDYPSYFHQQLAADSSVAFSVYMAGAVGSMGPDMNGRKVAEGAQFIGETMAQQLALLANFGIQTDEKYSLTSFRLKLPLRSPQMKVSGGLRLRAWVFSWLMGAYDADISVMKLNNNLLVGMPCDFSGELALPLYEYAQRRGINLIITSFNGGYIGYVTKDEHYDLNKAETRSMNWYGPDSGAYFSEIVRRIIDTVSE